MPATTNDILRWTNYMNQYYVQNDAPITNTRIGSKKLNVAGGKYSIPEDKYMEFLKRHHEYLKVGGMEYLTEKQLDVGPILVDIDLHFSLDCVKRWYSENHLVGLMNCYLEELKRIYHIDQPFSVYLFEKKSPKKVVGQGPVGMLNDCTDGYSMQQYRMKWNEME
jgi:hypothetical protein